MGAWLRAAVKGGGMALAIFSFTRSLGATDARVSDRVATTFELDEPAAEVASFARAPLPPFRASYGRAQLYLSPFFHPVNGKYDLVVHFHGMGSIQEGNVDKVHLNAAVVSVNVGMGSGPYEVAFKDPQVFARLVGYTSKVIEKSGRAPGAHLGRLAVSAWSAGYGAVASLLRQPATAARLDAVLLEDGLHSDWVDEKRHIVSDPPLAKYARIADAAIRGDMLFAITHSAIHTDGYPSSTETTGELLRLLGVEKTAHEATGPRGMLQIYESDRGDFHVKGYEGIGVKDHIDHIRAMNETVLPYLKVRWER